jgi:hypothetical protein
MLLEDKVSLVLTEVKEDKGSAFASFSDREGNHLASIYCDTEPYLSTKRLEVKGKDNFDEREALISAVRDDPVMKDKEVVVRDYPFRVIQVKTNPQEARDFIQREKTKTFDNNIYSVLTEEFADEYKKIRESFADITTPGKKIYERLKQDHEELEKSGKKDDSYKKKLFSYQKMLTGVEWALQDYKDNNRKDRYCAANKINTKKQKSRIEWEELGPIGSIINTDKKIIDIFEEKKTIFKETDLSKLLSEARKTKKKADSLRMSGKFGEALDLYYKAQELYETVIDQAENSLTDEDDARGVDFTYIHNEYSEMTIFIQFCREEKLKKEERESGRFND